MKVHLRSCSSTARAWSSSRPRSVDAAARHDHRRRHQSPSRTPVPRPRETIPRAAPRITHVHTTSPCSWDGRTPFRIRVFLLRAGIELRPSAVYLTPCHSTFPKSGTSCTKSREKGEQESKTTIRRPKQPPPSRPARPDAPRPNVATPCATLRNNCGPRASTRGPCCAGELNFQQVVVEAKEHVSNWLSILEPLVSQHLVMAELPPVPPWQAPRAEGRLPGRAPRPGIENVAAVALRSRLVGTSGERWPGMEHLALPLVGLTPAGDIAH